LPHQTPVQTTSLLLPRTMPRPFHSSQFYHPNNSGWGVQIIKHYVFFSLSGVTGKAIPIQAWTGPEGSRRLRLPDFMTICTWRWVCIIIILYLIMRKYVVEETEVM
jgi:hypothetical protein